MIGSTYIMQAQRNLMHYLYIYCKTSNKQEVLSTG